jgi:hypothetical protein
MFKRRLQKWGVAKNATSDKMDRVVESLKRTNERELTQPCPDKEMLVEGYKVTLSQVKRYIRRKKSSRASHADANDDDLPMSGQDIQPQRSFTKGSATNSSELTSTSILSLTDSPRLFLSPEEVVDLYSQAANYRRSCMSGSIFCLSYAALTPTYDSNISFRFSTIFSPIPFSTIGAVGFLHGRSKSTSSFRCRAAAPLPLHHHWTQS